MKTPTQTKISEAEHKRFVGENLTRAREAVDKTPTEWVRRYPTYLTSQSKLTNWENGDYYPSPLFLKKLCEDYGLTMDWFYRRVLSGVSASVADDLLRAEAGKSASSSAEGR